MNRAVHPDWLAPIASVVARVNSLAAEEIAVETAEETAEETAALLPLVWQRWGAAAACRPRHWLRPETDTARVGSEQ